MQCPGSGLGGSFLNVLVSTAKEARLATLLAALACRAFTQSCRLTRNFPVFHCWLYDLPFAASRCHPGFAVEDAGFVSIGKESCGELVGWIGVFRI
eukprot:4520905-Amphidinium_carterae.1